MPTSTHTDPFAPRGHLSRAQLLAYAEGRLSPSEQREVEAHLENDPLLREALEGLRMPGAIAALDGWAPPREVRAANGARWMWAGGVAVVAIGLVWWAASRTDTAPNAVAAVHEQAPAADAARAADEVPLQPAEIAAAVEIPESLHIGHDAEEQQLRKRYEEHVAVTVRDTSVVRTNDVQPIDRRTQPVDRTVGDALPLNPPAKPSSIQLLYLHDLKLVDPSSMYARPLLLRVEDNGVDASHADRSSLDQERRNVRNMTYTAFMDEALAKFVANDHRGCLEELRFLLDQYPNDVNARFYAGLCCYNLGLYKRARTFLHLAATDAFGVFDEEATWYHALTLDRLGEHESAHEAFTRIAAANGFYAERARKELAGL